MLQKLSLFLAAGLSISPVNNSYAIEQLDPEILLEQIQKNVQSCNELWQQVRQSDCSNRMIGLLEGGYIAVGLSAYSLDVNLDNTKTRARFDGSPHIAPLYTINTGLHFFDKTEFGYGMKVSYQQAYALHQTVSRDNKNVTSDLGSYAISDTLSTEVSLYYVNGFKDQTPDVYFAFGVGFGAGYGDVTGKAYLTENIKDSNTACYQAGTDLVNGVSGAVQSIKQNCELNSFHRFGLGFSGQLTLDFRYKNLLVGLATRVLRMDAQNPIGFGTKKYSFSPATNSLTVAYLIDL